MITSYVNATMRGTTIQAKTLPDHSPTVSMTLMSFRTASGGSCMQSAASLGASVQNVLDPGANGDPRWPPGRGLEDRPALLLLRRPVVVRRELVRREHEALRGNHEPRVLLLRLEDLLEERVLRGLRGRDLVPGLEELDQDVVRGLEDLDLVLLLQLLDGVGVLLLPLGPPPEEDLRGRRLEDLLDVV